MFFLEFGDTAFVARDPGRGEIAGYLLGFVAPSGDGYIHFVAVRDDSRTLGLGRRLYEAFENAARERGAVALKAITSPENEGFCGVSQPRRLHRDDPHRGLWRRRPDTHRDAQAALVSCLSQE